MTIRATITGRLGRDAESRVLNDGTPVANFSVASDDRSKKDAPAQWVRCALFGKRADALRPYLLKGKQVVISGTIVQREYQGKDGSARAGMECRVEDIELMGGRQDGDGQQNEHAPTQTRAAQTSGRSYGNHAPVDPFGAGDDDIPF